MRQLITRTKIKPLLIILLALTCLPFKATYSLPIDWSGEFDVDATMIESYRNLEPLSISNSNDAGSHSSTLGTGGHENASFESYRLSLSPLIVVNDSVSLKGEVTTNYPRGGFLGENSIQSKNTSLGNALYLQNNIDDTQSKISLTKMYMTLYSNTATYLIGRHSAHWGLGAVINNGKGPNSRHFTARDGITMKVKIGNFKIAPYWAKISQGGSLTRTTMAKEYGVSLLYDNPVRDITFGLLYSKKKTGSFNTTFQTELKEGTTTSYALGQTDVKLIDLYFKKVFYKFNFTLEVPLLSGTIGYAYDNGYLAKYKAKAIIAESTYQASNRLVFGLNAGTVSGDSGTQSSFDAMYLNPNYHIANLLFRYNLNAIGTTSSGNVYDAYITNAKYLKFFAEYSREKWKWKLGVVHAIANEIAETGKKAYNHTNNKEFTAVADQKDDIGTEVDFDCNYQWNQELSLGISAAYLFTGDYFAYNNSATPNNPKNSYMLQIKSSLRF